MDLEAIKRDHSLGGAHQSLNCVKCVLIIEVERLKAEVKELEGRVGLSFEVTKALADFKLAKDEIKGLKAQIDTIGTADDPLWVKACELKAELNEANGKITALEHTEDLALKGLRRERDELKAENERLEAKMIRFDTYRRTGRQQFTKAINLVCADNKLLREALERLKRINIHEAPNFHNRVTVESIRIIDEALKGDSQ